MPPDQVGSGGQLQEWLDDVDATYDSGHRHCSHLVGFFPGDEISTYYTPALAAAAKHSVDLRGYANSGLTPWSCAWRLNLRDRLQDGDGAWTNLLFLYGYNKVATNLIFADTNRQLDCSFRPAFRHRRNVPPKPVWRRNPAAGAADAAHQRLVSGLCARGRI